MNTENKNLKFLDPSNLPIADLKAALDFIESELKFVTNEISFRLELRNNLNEAISNNENEQSRMKNKVKGNLKLQYIVPGMNELSVEMIKLDKRNSESITMKFGDIQTVLKKILDSINDEVDGDYSLKELYDLNDTYHEAHTVYKNTLDSRLFGETIDTKKSKRSQVIEYRDFLVSQLSKNLKRRESVIDEMTAKKFNLSDRQIRNYKKNRKS